MLTAPLPQRIAAEFIGTFFLVFAGCGSAVLAGAFVSDSGVPGVGSLGVSLAFGLTVLAMWYAVGHISGGHFNPAVTLGVAIAGRVKWRDVAPYIGTQVVAAVAAAAVLFVVASGRDGFSASESGFATNGYGDLSPGGYSLLAAAVAEIVLTAFFLFIVLGASDPRALKNVAPIAIGFGLTVVHLVSIPVTNTSVNPARSIGPALFAGADPLGQLWLFIVAPILGSVIAGASYTALLGKADDPTPEEASAD